MYTLDQFISRNVFLLNNCFSKFGNLYFNQIKGIPMGYSCSPIWCNLYLSWFEFEHIRKLSGLNKYEMNYI